MVNDSRAPVQLYSIAVPAADARIAEVISQIPEPAWSRLEHYPEPGLAHRRDRPQRRPLVADHRSARCLAADARDLPAPGSADSRSAGALGSQAHPAFAGARLGATPGLGPASACAKTTYYTRLEPFRSQMAVAAGGWPPQSAASAAISSITAEKRWIEA